MSAILKAFLNQTKPTQVPVGAEDIGLDQALLLSFESINSVETELDTIEDLVTLEHRLGELIVTVESLDNVDANTLKLLHTATRSVFAGTGIDPTTHLPSLESHDGSVVSMEKFKDFLVKLWEAIKERLAKLWEVFKLAMARLSVAERMIYQESARCRGLLPDIRDANTTKTQVPYPASAVTLGIVSGSGEMKMPGSVDVLLRRSERLSGIQRMFYDNYVGKLSDVIDEVTKAISTLGSSADLVAINQKVKKYISECSPKEIVKLFPGMRIATTGDEYAALALVYDRILVITGPATIDPSADDAEFKEAVSKISFAITQVDVNTPEDLGSLPAMDAQDIEKVLDVLDMLVVKGNREKSHWDAVSLSANARRLKDKTDEAIRILGEIKDAEALSKDTLAQIARLNEVLTRWVVGPTNRFNEVGLMYCRGLLAVVKAHIANYKGVVKETSGDDKKAK